jgi:uncharacterized protein YjiS (DUF1127 family)
MRALAKQRTATSQIPARTAQSAERSTQTARGWFDRIELWLARRRQRKALAELATRDDHLLRDIGLSRGEAEREAAKPFWR